MGKTVALEGCIISLCVPELFLIFLKLAYVAHYGVKPKSDEKKILKHSWPTWHYVYEVLDVATSFKEFTCSIPFETPK